jgi:hypothetical protein
MSCNRRQVMNSFQPRKSEKHLCVFNIEIWIIYITKFSPGLSMTRDLPMQKTSCEGDKEKIKKERKRWRERERIECRNLTFTEGNVRSELLQRSKWNLSCENCATLPFPHSTVKSRLGFRGEQWQLLQASHCPSRLETPAQRRWVQQSV